jgi:glycosyltransferase involved in cell wall biosynthesis
LRIGLIIYGSLSTVSGGYLYDRKLVEYLRSRGDEVTVFSLPYRNYTDHLLDNFSAGLLQRLRQAKLDFLLQDELNHPSLFWLNRSLRSRYPLVSIVHHLRSSEARPAWQNAFYRLVEWLYLRSVGGYVFNSQTTKGVVERLARGKRPSVVAVPGGDQLGKTLAVERIEIRAHREGPLRVLFVGNIIPRKGLHTLLAALGRLDPSRWRLTVIGSPDADPKYTARIMAQIAASQLDRNVVLVGPLNGSALLDQYANHQALVVPSSYEGYGIVYVEGMAFGLPAIATSAGAAGEVITSNVDGFLVRPGDTVGLAGCIQSLISDRELLAQMSLAARARYDRQPTWEQTARAIRSFLQRFPIRLPVTSPLRGGPT